VRIRDDRVLLETRVVAVVVIPVGLDRQAKCSSKLWAFFSCSRTANWRRASGGQDGTCTALDDHEGLAEVEVQVCVKLSRSRRHRALELHDAPSVSSQCVRSVSLTLAPAGALKTSMRR
jgi:hypothetical protein